jgi:ATP-dependent DNA ligase
MEAAPVNDLPTGQGWLFEPKYDGFRCILFRDFASVHVQSRRQRPLGRYFPEIIEAASRLPIKQFAFDGELVIPRQPFDTLQLRLHPAASRVQLLSRQHPAQIVVFDLLANEDGQSLLDRPFSERRAMLETTFKQVGKNSHFVLSKATKSRHTARGWLKRLGHGLDGIVAKRLDLPYRPGERAMQKYKLWQTVDCVVGGIYYKRGTPSVEYLLMGLYDDAGKLNYVGRCGIGENGHEIALLLKPLIGGSGFTGNAPGGTSRWSGRERKPVPLKPNLVAEVSADHIENGRFRHGSRFIRWRDDKEPAACTMDQIIRL